MAKKRLEVTEKIEDLWDCFTGDLRNVINSLMLLKQKHLKKYNELKVVEEYNDCHECEGSHYTLYGTRFETDKEYERRLKKEKTKREKNKSNKLAQEEEEKKQLRKLAKKYPEEIKK